MAFYAKVRCSNCRGIFDIYRKSMDCDTPQKCPFCDTMIPRDLWPALTECFRSVEAWNGQAKNMFAVEIRRHYVPNHRCEV